jgi:outer membrane protein assembly factor BamB
VFAVSTGGEVVSVNVETGETKPAVKPTLEEKEWVNALALDKASGNVVWNSGPGKPGYASAVPFDMQNRRCVLLFVAEGLICADAGSGEKLWTVPWKTDYDVHAADPIVSGDRIFISSGYGAGCALIRVEDGKPTVAWRNREMKNQFSACVLRDGHLYGADGNVGQAVVKCMDFQTGQVKWPGPRLGMASLMLADGKLIIQGDGGRLIVAQATPEKFTPLADAKVHEEECWTMPVLSGGLIYCRNTGRSRPGELVCLDVRAR